MAPGTLATFVPLPPLAFCSAVAFFHRRPPCLTVPQSLDRKQWVTGVLVPLWQRKFHQPQSWQHQQSGSRLGCLGCAPGLTIAGAAEPW